MEEAKKRGIEILENHDFHPNDAVMFDIDDTLIYYNMKPNTSIIELAKRSKDLGYKVVIITARPDYKENRRITEDELKVNNIEYDLLFYTTHHNKHNIKQQLSSNFILSVGDMWTDVTNSLHYIKLPLTSNNENTIIVR